MSLVDLSLDDIIRRQRQGKKGGAKRMDAGNRSVNRPKTRGRGNFVGKYESGDTVFTKSKNVPTGRWGHDGYEEMYGGVGGGTRKLAAFSGGKLRSARSARTYDRGSISRKVTIHITNLAPTVTSDDLNELFEEYPIESAIVNYDEAGQSVGTADVTTDRASAQEIATNFSGVAIDDRTMRLFIIDESEGVIPSRSIGNAMAIKQRVSYRSPPKTRGIMKANTVRGIFKGGRGRKRAPIGGNRKGGIANKENDKRKKMTEAELDKELDEYMKKGANSRMET